MRKRRQAPIVFAVSAVLSILALFVLDGAARGIALLAAIIVFVLACMLALRGREADAGAMERGGWGGF